MIKLVFLVLIFSLGACQQLMQGQTQPVKSTDLNKGIYFTTCSGGAEDWGSCNNKAQNTCAKGYDVLQKAENSVGARRELTFQCKK